MALLTREQILNAKDIKTKRVFVEEWGGEVIVKALSSKERDEYEASVITMDKSGRNFHMNMENAKAKLVQLAVVDENMNRLFEKGDIEALGQKSASALNKVYEVAQELAGLKAEEVEMLVKN